MRQLTALGARFAQVRAEALTILSTVGRGEQIARYRLCEVYKKPVPGISSSAQTMVFISLSDKTHRVRALKLLRLPGVNAYGRFPQHKRMMSEALRAKNVMFCPVGAMVRRCAARN